MSVPPHAVELAQTRPAGVRPGRYSVVLNALPLAMVAAGVTLVWCIEGTAARVALAMAWIYLLPPLVARLAIALLGAPSGENLTEDTRAYRVWWLLVQLQVPFNRFPSLEEGLRLVPGAYAFWLNLWGSRVSPLVYWGPGAIVLDRHALTIGRAVVIGTRSVVSGHLATKDEAGTFRVTLAPVTIGDGVLIGVYAGIGPGCVIDAGSEVPAVALLRPYTRWTGDRWARMGRPQNV